jgi:hypothetical protein
MIKEQIDCMKRRIISAFLAGDIIISEGPLVPDGVWFEDASGCHADEVPGVETRRITVRK